MRLNYYSEAELLQRATTQRDTIEYSDTNTIQSDTTQRDTV